MILLASDTSTAQGSVALRDQDGILHCEEFDGSRPHSETLLPAVERLLDRAGLTRRDVQALAVGAGPGAFTGLRVGLATFQGWAAAAGLPLVPVVSLDAVACRLLDEGYPAMVTADARKGEVYAAYYPRVDQKGLPHRQGPIELLKGSEVEAWMDSLADPGALLAGTAVRELRQRGFPERRVWNLEDPGVPRAREILSLGEILLDLGRSVEPSGLVPVYVRPPDATPPSPGAMITGMAEENGENGGA